MRDEKIRSIAKTISWRIVATLITVGLVFIFTGSIYLAFGVGSIEVLAKFLFYYGHERIWERTKWGRKKEDS